MTLPADVGHLSRGLLTASQDHSKPPLNCMFAGFEILIVSRRFGPLLSVLRTGCGLITPSRHPFRQDLRPPDRARGLLLDVEPRRTSSRGG